MFYELSEGQRLRKKMSEWTLVFSRYPILRASSSLDRGFLGKVGHSEVTCRMQSFHFAHLIRPISPVFYGGVTHWCAELAQQIPVQSSSSIGKSIAKVNEQLDRPLAPEEVNTLMRAPETDVQASSNRLREHQEKVENPSKEIKVTQTCEIAGFKRKVSPGQCFQTSHDNDD